MICLFLPTPMPVIISVSVHTICINLLIFWSASSHCAVAGASPHPSGRHQLRSRRWSSASQPGPLWTRRNSAPPPGAITHINTWMLASEEENKLVETVCLPLFLILWTPATGRSPLPGGRGHSPSPWSSWGRRQGCHRHWRVGTEASPRCWDDTASPGAGGRSRTRSLFPGSEENDFLFSVQTYIKRFETHIHIYLLLHGAFSVMYF